MTYTKLDAYSFKHDFSLFNSFWVHVQPVDFKFLRKLQAFDWLLGSVFCNCRQILASDWLREAGIQNLLVEYVLKSYWAEKLRFRWCHKNFEVKKFHLYSIFSALEDKEGEWKPQKDSYYDFDEEARDKNQYDNERKKAQAKQSYVKRVIVHPNFKNIEFKRAERILDNREKDKSDVGDVDYSQGDCIIRPSSKGNSNKLLWICILA